MTKPLPIEVAALSDVGRVRANNEDSYLVYLPPVQEAAGLGLRALLVVADGMGGHALGELASQTAVKAFTEALFAYLTKHPNEKEKALREAVNHANTAVHRLAQGEGKGRPGTTLTALLLGDDSFYIAHVGDSRIYLLRDGQLRQLTTDHTWVAQEIARGRMKPQEAQNSPFKNYLTRALGSKPQVEGDISAGGLREGDLFLLCSDGLTGHVSDEEIARLLGSNVSLQESCERLVAMANERGGHDNITVLLAQVGLRRPRPTRTPLRQSEIPTLPYIPRPVLKKRKQVLWGNWLLAILVGAVLGLILGLAWKIWQSAKLHQLPEPQILKPQRSTVGSTLPTTQPILLQLKLAQEGIQFTARNGEMSVTEKAREIERNERGIFVRFKFPQRSYSALKSGEAKVVLLQGNKRHECLLTSGEGSIQVTEGKWEILYVDEEVNEPLCTLMVRKVVRAKSVP